MIDDASAFFSTWRDQFGRLSQAEVEGINALLAEMEGRRWLDRRWWAYVLATAWHETAGTMQPIAEYGKGRGRAYGKPDPRTGKTYYGRGFVQLTWKDNYERLGAELGIDLAGHPDDAMKPDVAAEIMCLGMAKGLFTGKALGDYFDADTDDPVNARRIVNGTDKAALIAGYHAKALAAVSAGWLDPEPVDRVAELEAEVVALRERAAASRPGPPPSTLPSTDWRTAVLEPRDLPPAVTPGIAVQADPQPTNKVAAAANAGGGIGAIIAGGMTLYGDGAIREVLANVPMIGEKSTDLLVFLIVSAAVYLGTKYGARAAAYNVLDKPNVPLVPAA